MNVSDETYLDNVPITMEDDEIRDFWVQWERENPGSSPLLSSLLPRWEQIARDGEPIAWQDAQMENPQDPDQVDFARQRLEQDLTEALNRAALKRLTELTTLDCEEAIEMTLYELREKVKRTTDPLARIALLEGVPVDVGTQIGWLTAWWVQDTQATGLPTPSWVIRTASNWPEPRWDPTSPPRPTWLTQWHDQ